MPVYFLNAYGGLSYVGNYSFANRMLGLPISLFGASIGDVFRQKATEQYIQNGECLKLFLNTMKGLFFIGFFPCLVLLLFGPSLFQIVFGKEWREAGVIAQYLSVLFLARIVVSPLTYMYFVAGKMREDFIIHVFMVFFIGVSFLIGSNLFPNSSLMVVLYGIAYTLVYGFYLFRSYVFARGKNHSKTNNILSKIP